MSRLPYLGVYDTRTHSLVPYWLMYLWPHITVRDPKRHLHSVMVEIGDPLWEVLTKCM